MQIYWEATDLEYIKVSRSFLLGNVSYNMFKEELFSHDYMLGCERLNGLNYCTANILSPLL